MSLEFSTKTIALCAVVMCVLTSGCSAPLPGDPQTDLADEEPASNLDAGAADTSDGGDEQGDASGDDSVEDTGEDLPQEPVVSELDELGDYQVAVEDGVSLPGMEGRSVEATLCSPIADGEAWPLLILMPGFQVPRQLYTSYCEYAASWGFFVVLQSYSNSSLVDPRHPELADDVTGIIDWAETQSEFDGEHVAVGGHSMGGKIALMATSQDSRVDAFVGIDPVDPDNDSTAPERVSQITQPALILGEMGDAAGLFACAPEAGNFRVFYDALESSVLEVEFFDADHFDFTDTTDCLACGFCQQGDADDVMVRLVTRRTLVAFLRYHLLGEAMMETYLTGDVIGSVVEAGLIAVRHK